MGGIPKAYGLNRNGRIALAAWWYTKVIAILTYHVVPGALFATDVLAQNELTTVQGSNVTVDADNVRINASNIVQADIEASNGVIHVIDAVLLPPAQ